MSIRNPEIFIPQFEELNSDISNFVSLHGMHADSFSDTFMERIDTLRDTLGTIKFDQPGGNLICDREPFSSYENDDFIKEKTKTFKEAVSNGYNAGIAEDLITGYREATAQISLIKQDITQEEIEKLMESNKNTILNTGKKAPSEKAPHYTMN